MAGRIKRMRRELYQALQDVGAPGSWRPVTEAIGMFAMLGLSKVGFCAPFSAMLTLSVLPGRVQHAGFPGMTNWAVSGLLWET